ncbi:MAG: hypothetical protein IKX48_11875 [Victivallales bacterium]|nr:hypothetical protein [Victivallales bacterium]
MRPACAVRCDARVLPLRMIARTMPAPDGFRPRHWTNCGAATLLPPKAACRH